MRVRIFMVSVRRVSSVKTGFRSFSSQPSRARVIITIAMLRRARRPITFHNQ